MRSNTVRYASILSENILAVGDVFLYWSGGLICESEQLWKALSELSWEWWTFLSLLTNNMQNIH